MKMAVFFPPGLIDKKKRMDIFSGSKEPGFHGILWMKPQIQVPLELRHQHLLFFVIQWNDLRILKKCPE
jgi:hypothetical protein